MLDQTVIHNPWEAAVAIAGIAWIVIAFLKKF
jgi:hypothetical protein